MNLFKKMSLKSRITLMSVALTVLISGISSVSFYRNISRDLESNTLSHSNSLSFQISSYLDERLRSIITRVYSLVSSSSYIGALTEYLLYDNEYQYPLTFTRLNGLISDIKMNDPFISSVYICTPKGNFYDLSSYPKKGFNFLESDLYKEYEAAGGASLYTGYRRMDEIFTGNKSVIPMVVKASIPGYLGNVYLVINISGTEMDNYLAKSTSGNEDLLLVDLNHKKIASNNSAMDEVYLSLIKTDGETVFWSTQDKDYIISATKLDTDNWAAVVFNNKDQLKATLNSSQYLVFLMIFSSILISAAFSLFFSTRIVRPLELLQKSMLAVTKGDFSKRYEYNYNNEVGRLAKCYNYMVEKIGDLVAQLNSTIDQLKTEKENVKQEQVLKRKAELNALQAQINPHFLHNTLNSIVWLAAENQVDEISTLAAELANFYEYRIRGGKTIIRIRDEIEQVKSYLAIQKVRYGNSICYHFDLDESLMDNQIIKLVLQPLVENAIFHGVQCKDDGDKHIYIRSYADNETTDIFIEVEDNGMGIDSEKLERMNLQLASVSCVPTNGYGIYNVNERIKLYFGREYGLSYKSEYGKWTLATLHIPSQESLDGEEEEL